MIDMKHNHFRTNDEIEALQEPYRDLGVTQSIR